LIVYEVNNLPEWGKRATYRAMKAVTPASRAKTVRRTGHKRHISLIKLSRRLRIDLRRLL
jgi:hypothetical protein